MSRNQIGSLAMRYYPHLGYKAALRLFRHELQVTHGLMSALKENGYHEHQRTLTRSQQKVIEEYLGEP